MNRSWKVNISPVFQIEKPCSVASAITNFFDPDYLEPDVFQKIYWISDKETNERLNWELKYLINQIIKWSTQHLGSTFFKWQ